MARGARNSFKKRMVHTNSSLADTILKIPVYHAFSVRAVLTPRGKGSSIFWERGEAQQILDITVAGGLQSALYPTKSYSLVFSFPCLGRN